MKWFSSILIACTILIIDQGIKILLPAQKVLVDSYVINIAVFQNKNMAFGLPFSGWPLLIMQLAIVCTLIWYVYSYYKRKKYCHSFGLVLVITGAISNIIDRIRFGYVVDYIALFPDLLYAYSIFNIADISIVIGLIFFIVCFLKKEYHET